MASLEQRYVAAKEQYEAWGVDCDAALDGLRKTALSMHCWQGDDVRGFEGAGDLADGGIMATGNYPGAARTPDALRADMAEALRLIPGRHRVNLHAIYAETGGRRVERNALEPEHFSRWTDWARDAVVGVDFNPTFFSHPKADSGFTL
ncbi:MAG: L-rhamnose isomerase, partial [Lentisphaerae bacterium]|nr:L-rhamnose isomerase [Lentisphaerota bacterium]